MDSMCARIQGASGTLFKEAKRVEQGAVMITLSRQILNVNSPYSVPHISSDVSSENLDYINIYNMHSLMIVVKFILFMCLLDSVLTLIGEIAFCHSWFTKG